MSSLALRSAAARIASSLAILVGTAACPAAQAQPPRTDTSRGLSIQYADGQISTGPVRRTGGMWTSTFPTVAGADTSREGVPLTTLDVKHVVEGRDVVVTVSLFYGGPGRNGVKVATVRVSPDEPVQVPELRAYGVQPITLSLVPIAAAVAYAPEVSSVSAQLSVRAEAAGPNVSAYRVVVTNHSRSALMWLQFKAYRGDRVAIMGAPRGKRNLALVLPDAEYGFDVTTSTGGLAAADQSETWQPIDRIEVIAVMWQDGVVEGSPVSVLDQRRIDVNRAAQIAALLALLRGAREDSIATLRDRVAQSMSSDLETRRARDSVLNDLDTFVRTRRSPDAQDFAAWRTRTIAEYEEWLARIVVAKS